MATFLHILPLLLFRFLQNSPYPLPDGRILYCAADFGAFKPAIDMWKVYRKRVRDSGTAEVLTEEEKTVLKDYNKVATGEGGRYGVFVMDGDGGNRMYLTENMELPSGKRVAGPTYIPDEGVVFAVKGDSIPLQFYVLEMK